MRTNQLQVFISRCKQVELAHGTPHDAQSEFIPQPGSEAVLICFHDVATTPHEVKKIAQPLLDSFNQKPHVVYLTYRGHGTEDAQNLNHFTCQSVLTLTADLLDTLKHTLPKEIYLLSIGSGAFPALFTLYNCINTPQLKATLKQVMLLNPYLGNTWGNTFLLESYENLGWVNFFGVSNFAVKTLFGHRVDFDRKTFEFVSNERGNTKNIPIKVVEEEVKLLKHIELLSTSNPTFPESLNVTVVFNRADLYIHTPSSKNLILKCFGKLGMSLQLHTITVPGKHTIADEIVANTDCMEMLKARVQNDIHFPGPSYNVTSGQAFNAGENIVTGDTSNDTCTVM